MLKVAQNCNYHSSFHKNIPNTHTFQSHCCMIITSFAPKYLSIKKIIKTIIKMVPSNVSSSSLINSSSEQMLSTFTSISVTRKNKQFYCILVLTSYINHALTQNIDVKVPFYDHGKKIHGKDLSLQQMVETKWKHRWSLATSTGVGNSWTVGYSSHCSHTLIWQLKNQIKFQNLFSTALQYKSNYYHTKISL